MEKVQDNIGNEGLNAQANFFEDLEAGRLKPDQLTNEQLDQFLAAQDNVVQDDDNDYEAPATTQVPEKQTIVEDTIAPKKDAKQSLWEMQVEENRLKQKQEAARKRREELEQRLYGTVAKPTEAKPFVKPENYDPYAEENLAEIPMVKQELKTLKEELKALKEQRQRDEQENIHKELYALETEQIETLQEEFPELKTSKPFAQVEKEYASWYNSLGSERANKYLSDPVFREEMDKKGFKIPDDFDNYAALYEIRQSYKENKHSTLRAAFKDSHLYDQLVERRFNSKGSVAQNTAQEKAIEKLAQIKNQTPILDTTQSATPIEKMVMNEKDVEKELIQLGKKNNLTPTEKARYNAIMEMLGIPL